MFLVPLLDLKLLVRTSGNHCRSFKSAAPANVDNHPAQPYLCPIVSMAIAFILLRFWPLNVGLSKSHSLADGPRVGAFAVARHGELIGNPVDHVTAVTQDGKGRNLA